MKSKFLLSLSFLTAVFSVNADNATFEAVDKAWIAFEKMNRCDAWKKAFPESAAKVAFPGELGYTKLCVKAASAKILKNAAFYSNIAKAVGLASAVAYVGYKHTANKAEAVLQAQAAEQAAELANKPWYTKTYESAQKYMTSGYAKAQNTYDTVKQHTTEKPYHAAIGLAGALGLTYAVYSWYYAEPALA